VEQHPRHEGAHHVLGAVGEVDDVEEPEDHREAEAQRGVEGAVDEPEQELPEEGRRGDAQDLRHCGWAGSGAAGWAEPLSPAGAAAEAWTNGQPPSSSGRKAWSPGIVASSL
jgi:hypothetical protein